jgi:uncharacterized membrane protein YgcG
VWYNNHTSPRFIFKRKECIFLFTAIWKWIKSLFGVEDEPKKEDLCKNCPSTTCPYSKHYDQSRAKSISEHKAVQDKVNDRIAERDRIARESHEFNRSKHVATTAALASDTSNPVLTAAIVATMLSDDTPRQKYEAVHTLREEMNFPAPGPSAVVTPFVADRDPAPTPMPVINTFTAPAPAYEPSTVTSSVVESSVSSGGSVFDSGSSSFDSGSSFGGGGDSGF